MSEEAVISIHACEAIPYVLLRPYAEVSHELFAGDGNSLQTKTPIRGFKGMETKQSGNIAYPQCT